MPLPEQCWTSGKPEILYKFRKVCLMRIAVLLMYSIMGILFLTSTCFYQRLNGAFVTLRKQRLVKAAVYIGLSVVVNTVILSQDAITPWPFWGLFSFFLRALKGACFTSFPPPLSCTPLSAP